MGAPPDFHWDFARRGLEDGSVGLKQRGRRRWGRVETRPSLSLSSSSLSSRVHQRFLDPIEGWRKASAGLKRRRKDEGISSETRPRRAILESDEGSVSPNGEEIKAAGWIR
ncbi:hypothetical protein PVAP13_5KG412307 [Panicum virgatum]|uniref:Uncharacterized protein n=1 Tax=Panicum virgatum TaxID=38727 RepID=A0A8T0SHU6_PANVG|nr:hypothetical protein PVAP13_5KG412307 [Panicum virgatum]